MVHPQRTLRNSWQTLGATRLKPKNDDVIQHQRVGVGG